jgi:hypothetical protein
VQFNVLNNRDENFVSHFMVLSHIFFDKHGDVRNDVGISFSIFQGAVVRRRAAVRKYGLHLQRLCDCRRSFDTPPDLDRVDDDRHDAAIPDDGVGFGSHSGDALLLRGNGDIAGLDAEPLAVPLVYGVDLIGPATGCPVVLAVLTLVDSVSALFLSALWGRWRPFFASARRTSAVPGDPLFPVARLRILARPSILVAAFALLAFGNAVIQPYRLKLSIVKNMKECG